MSESRIDHAAEARLALEGSGDGRNFATDASVNAVAHAALALVEQTRIANLIALEARWGAETGDSLIASEYDELGFRTGYRLNADVSAALGIGATDGR